MNINTPSIEKPKLIIVAWHLVGQKHGHFYPYWLSVKNLFEKNGFEVITLANIKLKKKNLPINDTKNLFPCLLYGRINFFFFNFLSSFSFFLSDIITTIIISIKIQSKLKQYNPNKDIIFIQDIFCKLNLMLPFFAFRKTKFKTFTLIRGPIEQNKYFKLPFFKSIYFAFSKNLLIQLFKKNKNVIPGTDSIVTAKQLESATQRNDVVVYPVYPSPHIRKANTSSKYINKKKIVVSTPGTAGTGVRFYTKGFDTIMTALKHIVKNKLYPIEDKIIFMFQKSGSKNLYYDNLINLLKELNIEYVPQKHYLNEEEYNNFLDISDIILLPYKLEYGFNVKTSGTYIEAIITKKNVISTKDSWMYHISKNKIHSNLFFTNNDAIDLAEKLIELVSNYSHYKSKTEEAKKYFEKIHNEESFFKCFVK